MASTASPLSTSADDASSGDGADDVDNLATEFFEPLHLDSSSAALSESESSPPPAASPASPSPSSPASSFQRLVENLSTISQVFAIAAGCRVLSKDASKRAASAIDAALRHVQICYPVLLSDPASISPTCLSDLAAAALDIENGVAISGDKIQRPSSFRLITILLLLRSLPSSLPSSLHDACHSCIPPHLPYARKTDLSVKSHSSFAPGMAPPEASLRDILNTGSSFYTHLHPDHLSRYETLCASVFAESRPTAALYRERLDFIREICMCLSPKLPHASSALLIMCGSCASLLSHAESDLDVTLLLEPPADRQSKDEHERLMRGFCKGLSRSHQAPKMRSQFIHSRVPIVHVSKGMHECDIVLNKTDNIVKAFLFELYVRLDSRVAPLIHIIKSWARLPQIDLNDASRATFNSFSITLMILGYLQSIVPPVLPCIQAPQVRMADGSTFEPHWAWHPRMDVDPSARDAMSKHIVDGLRGFGAANTMNVAELLLGFFRYYSCVFEFSNWAVCVGDGKPRLKSQTPSVQGQRREIVVQDPIVPLENTCRGISGDVLDRLRVHMFIELLRAHQGYYNAVPGVQPSIVFSPDSLMQHSRLAHNFVEECRMTRMKSTAPPPPPPSPQEVQQQQQQQQQQQHRAAAAESASSKQSPGNQWTEAENARMWSIIHRRRPESDFDWSKVAAEYNSGRPERTQLRSKQAIRSRANVLASQHSTTFVATEEDQHVASQSLPYHAPAVSLQSLSTPLVSNPPHTAKAAPSLQPSPADALPALSPPDDFPPLTKSSGRPAGNAGSAAAKFASGSASAARGGRVQFTEGDAALTHKQRRELKRAQEFRESRASPLADAVPATTPVETVFQVGGGEAPAGDASGGQGVDASVKRGGAARGRGAGFGGAAARGGL